MGVGGSKTLLSAPNGSPAPGNWLPQAWLALFRNAIGIKGAGEPPLRGSDMGLLAQTRQRSQMQQMWCHRGYNHQEHYFIAQSGIGRLGSCFKNIFFSSLEIVCPYESLVTSWIKP